MHCLDETAADLKLYKAFIIVSRELTACPGMVAQAWESSILRFFLWCCYVQRYRCTVRRLGSRSDQPLSVCIASRSLSEDVSTGM
jgi:hypothetical protein